MMLADGSVRFLFTVSCTLSWSQVLPSFVNRMIVCGQMLARLVGSEVVDFGVGMEVTFRYITLDSVFILWAFLIVENSRATIPLHQCEAIP